jgi:hypothetical protein
MFKSAAGRKGGGEDASLTKVTNYNIVTGGGEMTHYPKDHYGAARVHKNPRVPGDMPLLYHPPPQTVGLCTFHHVLLQSKHQTMTPRMAHVTNLTHPGVITLGGRMVEDTN